MAGTQIQRRRGTTAEHSTFTGALGELTVDTDKKTVVVHDGRTAGGSPLAVAAAVASAYAPINSPNLTGTPTAPTATAGTNTKQIATTEFVQRALGSYAGAINISAGGTIRQEDVGKVTIFSSPAAGQTIYLPSLVGLPVGATILIHGYGTLDYTIGPQGGQDILARGTVLTSLPMKGADSAVLYKESNIRWVLIGGTVQEAYSPRQASFLASSGYQKLPSGLIIQWGVTNSASAGQAVSAKFAIAFPTACLQATMSAGTAGANVYVDGVTFTATTISGRVDGSGSSIARYIAIGH